MKSTGLKLLLVTQSIVLLFYTYLAYEKDGPNLFRVFLSNINSFSWSGQFNLDFLCYLILSGLWIMWRQKFNFKSIVIGSIAMVLGIVFFAPYFLWLIRKENGDLKRILIGSNN